MELIKEKKGNLFSYLTVVLLIFVLVAILISVADNHGSISLQDTSMQSAGQEELPEIGYIAPGFAYNDMHGKKVSLSENRGKVVFLNIWATWCGPCLAEMPSMEKLYNRFKSDQFEVLAVSVDRQGLEVVEPYIKKLGLTFPVLLDTDDTITYLYQVNSIPQTFIIDKNGTIVLKIIGARDWASEKSFEAIEYLINK